jgi:hypothetical protein
LINCNSNIGIPGAEVKEKITKYDAKNHRMQQCKKEKPRENHLIQMIISLPPVQSASSWHPP